MAKRILVAEDDPDNRCIVVKVLTLEGYQTVATDDGRSALALARRERPDLIVMDLGMPGMDGWEGARRLKADPQTADNPDHRAHGMGRGARPRGGMRWIPIETLPAEDHP